MRCRSSGGVLLNAFERFCARLRDECLRVYGPNLTSLIVFGSVGRGTPTHESDIDVLLVAKELPRGRMARIRQFEEVERAMSEDFLQARGLGIRTRLSPLFRTESEMQLGGLIFLDMVEDSKILLDRNDFFGRYIASLREKLVSMGAARVRCGSTWYWVLKPDLKPGEVFDI